MSGFAAGFAVATISIIALAFAVYFVVVVWIAPTVARKK